MRSLLVGALLLSACASPASKPAIQPDTTAAVVRTLGIPYAAAERWEVSAPNPGWRDAAPFDAMGPACPQKGQAVMTEDCLFLNVFAPEGADGLPVLVWIHGGGFVMGEGGEGPATFADDGVVGVSFNYRLGKLGFHDWAGWDESDPRNFGASDMVSALEWVRGNIAAFGGDPDRVTILGHSAGGMGVQLMMVDSRADGLFAQAVAHSGYAAWPFPEALNPTPEQRARMRIRALRTDAPPQTLVEEVSRFHLPYRGGSDLTAQPLELFRAGRSGTVPYLAGANTHDGLGTLEGAGFDAVGFLDQYEGKDLLTRAYSEFGTAQLRAEKQFGDMRYVYSSRETARAHRGPSALFLLDGPGHGRNHVEHYDELFGDGPSAYRDMLLRFIQDGELPDGAGWTVIDPGNAPPRQGAAALDARLDLFEGLYFPEPARK